MSRQSKTAATIDDKEEPDNILQFLISIRKAIKTHRGSLLLLLGMGLGAGGASWYLYIDLPTSWQANWLVNFSASMTAAFFTLLFIDLVLRQQDRDEERQEQRRLIRQQSEMLRRYAQGQAVVELLSAENPDAKRSILNEMVKYDLLRGANLQQVDLTRADLNEADIRGANFHLAHLPGVHMRGSRLNKASLCGADLEEADLRGADFTEADLRDVHLVNANCELITLEGANLQGATLRGAKIALHQLAQARSLEAATLPDGTSLPFGDSWRDRFAEWLSKQEQ